MTADYCDGQDVLAKQTLSKVRLLTRLLARQAAREALCSGRSEKALSGQEFRLRQQHNDEDPDGHA